MMHRKKHPGSNSPARVRGDMELYMQAGIKSAKRKNCAVYRDTPEPPGPNATMAEWDRYYAKVQAIREEGPVAVVSSRGTVTIPNSKPRLG